MEWGLKKADETGLESYTDATREGVPLYETCGFTKAAEVDFDASKDEPSPRWRELQQELLPFTFWPMWRPVRGHFEQGAKVPWEPALASQTNEF